MKQTVTWGLAPHVGSYFMFKRLPIIGVAYRGARYLIQRGANYSRMEETQNETKNVRG